MLVYGSMSVSSCICCMFVSCVHPVAVLNAAFCMTCCLLMLVEDASLRRGPYGISILQSRSHDCLIGIHECPHLLLLWVLLSFVVACVLVLKYVNRCAVCKFWV